ncbi:hypothetical protein [Streptomyces sp. CB01881]|uniref:hypothetical protein n=1 Tax=Streptomyces sp. CB01881 TaxID=2078691 RepID=UPI0011DF5965|nr:hypothetical protein [Streptomyces sp. CB01881]TYC70452.1 hypothetical protein EH183_31830 [Streptomyces sp. CB01881]
MAEAPSKSYPWETMIRAFAGSDHTSITDRDAVTAQKWITGHKLTTAPKATNDLRKVKGTVGSEDVAGYDMWAEWVYPTKGGATEYSTLLGVTCNWPFWDEPTAGATYSAFGSFRRNADLVLGPLLWGNVLANDKTSEKSFTTAATSIRTLDKWIADQRAKIQAWADSVDGAGSEFQGSAAGRFKEILVGLRGEFEELHIRLGGDGEVIAQQIEKARDGLHGAVASLYMDGYTAWGGKPTYEGTGSWVLQEETHPDVPESWLWPHACIRYAFSVGVAQVIPTLNANYEADFALALGVAKGSTAKTGVLVPPTDMAGDGFIDWLERTAVDKWKSWIVEKLDSAADKANSALTPLYNTTSGYLGTFTAPTMTLPTEHPPKTGPDAPPGTGGDGSSGGKGPDLGGGDKGGGLPPPPKADIGPPPPAKGDLSGIGGGTGGIGGGNGQSPLLGKDGKPLLGKDGKPLTVPPGTKVNDKGELIGPDGKPLLGSDGKPRHVPAGTTIGQPTSTGSVFRVPVGSKMNADGTVTGPDGAKLRDANGNPVVLGKNSTIDKDGIVRDAAGRPVSPLEQLLSDEEQALASRGGVATGGSTGGVFMGGGGGTGGYTGPPLSWGGLGETFGTGGTSGLRGTGTGTDLFGESSGGGPGLRTSGGIAAAGPPSLGVGGKMATTLGVAKGAAAMAEETAAQRSASAQRAAAATAAEEAELMGRRVATTGGAGAPMMPPPGGAGGAAGQGEKERQRTTWLAEDEEVWGTDAGGVTGVIGR